MTAESPNAVATTIDGGRGLDPGHRGDGEPSAAVADAPRDEEQHGRPGQEDQRGGGDGEGTQGGGGRHTARIEPAEPIRQRGIAPWSVPRSPGPSRPPQEATGNRMAGAR